MKAISANRQMVRAAMAAPYLERDEEQRDGVGPEMKALPGVHVGRAAAKERRRLRGGAVGCRLQRAGQNHGERGPAEYDNDGLHDAAHPPYLSFGKSRDPMKVPPLRPRKQC